MSYKTTNISRPPLNRWAPDDHTGHVSKPEESRWKHAKAASKTLPVDVIQEALDLERKYYRCQRQRGYELGMLFNGISEFFRGFRECRDKIEVGSSR